MTFFTFNSLFLYLGKKYLIHKGPNYGKSSQTVVVDAKHMSKKWTVRQPEAKAKGNVKIKDLVKVGGKKYNLWKGDHCQTASRNMYNKATGRGKVGKRGGSCKG